MLFNAKKEDNYIDWISIVAILHTQMCGSVRSAFYMHILQSNVIISIAKKKCFGSIDVVLLEIFDTMGCNAKQFVCLDV